jgi:hypothetical protein
MNELNVIAPYRYLGMWVFYDPRVGGNVYYSGDFDSEGWLCPALLRYFDEAPKKLYLAVRPAH